jgi:hypothetical protein
VANTRSGNVYFIDTQYATNEELAVKNLRVVGILVTSSAAGAQLILGDSSTTKLDLKVPIDEDTLYLDFSETPILFAVSIRPKTLTTCTAMVIIEETRA